MILLSTFYIIKFVLPFLHAELEVLLFEAVSPATCTKSVCTQQRGSRVRSVSTSVIYRAQAGYTVSSVVLSMPVCGAQTVIRFL